MTPETTTQRRNRLCYLALYYAIRGDDRRSEQVRRMVKRMDESRDVARSPMADVAVPA